VQLPGFSFQGAMAPAYHGFLFRLAIRDSVLPLARASVPHHAVADGLECPWAELRHPCGGVGVIEFTGRVGGFVDRLVTLPVPFALGELPRSASSATVNADGLRLVRTASVGGRPASRAESASRYLACDSGEWARPR